MAHREQATDSESLAEVGFLGLPSHYFGPTDGETALRADKMHANRIETEAMGALRSVLHDSETGFASRPPTERLGAYNLGRNGLKGWLDGDQSYDPNNTRAKWREMSTYLAYVLKGGDSDPHLGDMYRYEPPNGSRTSVKVGRSTTAPYPRSTVSGDPKENP